MQATITRINDSLIERGYVTWFDLTNMKGSVMDAMSEAVEGAEVMLYGYVSCTLVSRYLRLPCFLLLTHRIALSSVSLAYKESANCRECTNNLIAFDDATSSDSASTSDNTMSCVALHACRAGG